MLSYCFYKDILFEKVDALCFLVIQINHQIKLVSVDFSAA